MSPHLHGGLSVVLGVKEDGAIPTRAPAGVLHHISAGLRPRQGKGSCMALFAQNLYSGVQRGLE